MRPNEKPKVVVITGASAGVGRATARAFAEQGAAVALLARGKDGLAAAEKEIQEAGGRALAIPLDVANFEQVAEAAERIEKELGPIDIWVNNAMVSVLSPFREMTPQEFRRVTEVTYLGVVHGTFAALRQMSKRDRGAIIQVGSALSYRGIPLQSAYCGAKHAINGFTESLRCELLHDKSRIRLTLVQLPALNTPQFSWVKSRLANKSQPFPPVYQPELAAKAIVWASRHNRREIYVGLSTLKAIWADKIAPGLVDRYLSRTGYRGQQTEEQRPPGEQHNLFEPVPGDHGAHGEFNDQAHSWSLQLLTTLHRTGILAVLALMAGFWWIEQRSAKTRFSRLQSVFRG